MDIFITGLKDGLAMGSIYALMALGYSMVYGIVKMINFAHSEFITIGGFTAYVVCIKLFKIPEGTSEIQPVWMLIISLLIAIIVAVIIGLITERFAYRPLRKKGSSRITALITAIGVSYIIVGIINAIWPNTVVFPNFFTKNQTFIISIIVTVILMLGLTLFVTKTKMGIAMRAVSENEQASQLMGINNNFIIGMTFFIGSALAAIGAILFILRAPNFKFNLGSDVIGLYPFVAAVIGGIGSLPGAVIGGFLIGIISELAGTYGVAKWVTAFVYGIFIIILLFKPAGLLGKDVREKV